VWSTWYLTCGIASFSRAISNTLFQKASMSFFTLQGHISDSASRRIRQSDDLVLAITSSMVFDIFFGL
jgi:hypothetical protein